MKLGSLWKLEKKEILVRRAVSILSFLFERDFLANLVKTSGITNGPKENERRRNVECDSWAWSHVSEHETEQLVQLRHSKKFESTTKLKINNKFKRFRTALPLTTPPLTLLVIPK